MKYEYKPIGVCSTKMTFEIEDNIIKDIVVENGCPGNLLGIRALCKNQNIDDVINKLSGIKCRVKPTSCPDQIAKGLIKFKEENKKIQ